MKTNNTSPRVWLAVTVQIMLDYLLIRNILALETSEGRHRINAFWQIHQHVRLFATVFFFSFFWSHYSVFASSSWSSGYKNCLTVINHHHHLRASPSYSAAPSTEDPEYSWRNVVVSEPITNNGVRQTWKTGCHLWFPIQIIMLTLTEIRSRQGWFSLNWLEKHLQNLFNSLILGFILAVCLWCSSVVHHITWWLTNKPTSTIGKQASLCYLGTGREQLPASALLLLLWESTTPLISSPAFCFKSQDRQALLGLWAHLQPAESMSILKNTGLQEWWKVGDKQIPRKPVFNQQISNTMTQELESTQEPLPVWPLASTNSGNRIHCSSSASRVRQLLCFPS